MKTSTWVLAAVAVMIVLLGTGCARAARDTTGFALKNTTTVDAPYETTWQAVKAVLRERDMDIYTRDKRGVFVAYDTKKRKTIPVLHRTQYTIAIEKATEQSCTVTIETVKQVYGVTLLTYPGWHDRKASDETVAKAILDAVQTKAASS